MIIQPSNIQPQPISVLLGHSLKTGKRIWLSQFPFLFLIVSLLFWSEQALTGWAQSQQLKEAFSPLIMTPVNGILLSLYFVYVGIVLKRSHLGTQWDQQLQALTAFGSLVPVVILASLLEFAGVALGTLLLIIPGILLMIWFTVFPQVIAFEGMGAIAALKRSLFLVKGSTLRVLGIILIFAVVRAVLQYLPGFLFPAIASQPAIAFLLFLIREMLILPFEGAAYYLLYLELRTRKEAFDFDVYQEESSRM
ncbi:hypothetical protein NST37_02225 [Brevibacillus sp. FSL K6-6036]|uniref:hypothetical protein n=1 Tax=Brevibacillus sp. FSL K6-6036 TaxID=2954682 RepID=UPI0030D401FE